MHAESNLALWQVWKEDMHDWSNLVLWEVWEEEGIVRGNRNIFSQKHNTTTLCPCDLAAGHWETGGKPMLRNFPLLP